MAASWGLQLIVERLVSSGRVDVNGRDSDGRTALHVAIDNQHESIIQMLMSNAQAQLNLRIKDRKGMTPFALALLRKNEKVARGIVSLERGAAEEKDNKGRTFLHTAVEQNSVETVLFLLALRVNVNSKDANGLTPLHYAVIANNDMTVRNLILAGADINEKTPQKRTALHIAAKHDRASIASILLDNKIDFDTVDDSQANALHLAVQEGHVDTVRILLTQSAINAEAINIKGQNPMHVLCSSSPERAPAIFEIFIESMPNYPIDKQDANGSTPLLLAYVNAHGQLARALVRAHALLGTTNKEGLSIFNAPVASKSLLNKLLDMISKEPTWTEGDNCLECGVKFGIATRKHHCRHCGRLVCSKCSSNDMPIIKFNLHKPVRVCQVCFDVLNGSVL